MLMARAPCEVTTATFTPSWIVSFRLHKMWPLGMYVHALPLSAACEHLWTASGQYLCACGTCMRMTMVQIDLCQHKRTRQQTVPPSMT